MAWLLIFFTPFQAEAQSARIPIPLGFSPSIRQNALVSHLDISRPRITLALSGGGSRGFCQIGVLSVLEKNGIPVDGIAGTSIGAVIGGLYAAGYSADELDSLSKIINWSQILQDKPQRQQLFLAQKAEKDRYLIQLRWDGFSLQIPQGLTAGQKFSSLINQLLLQTSSQNIDELPIPYVAVCTDLLSGKKVLLNEGSLAQAMLASMAIPLLIKPVRLDGYWLVDGGLVQNLPVDEAKHQGGDLIIAVDATSKLRTHHHLRSPWEIADQVTTIMQQEQVEAQRNLADIVIKPELESFSNTDFEAIDTIIDAGKTAAEKAIDDIQNQYQRLTKNHPLTSYYLSSIEIQGCRSIDPLEVKNRISLETPSWTSAADIQWAAQSIYQTGFFADIHAELDTATQTLFFLVKENPRIAGVKISNPHVLPDSLIQPLTNSLKNRIFNHFEAEKQIQSFQTALKRHHGFLAKVDSLFIENDSLNVMINKGQINSIELLGNDKTKDHVILREIPFKEDDEVSAQQIEQAINNVYSTGYFSDVRFAIKRHGNNHSLFLRVTEQPNTLVRFGARYDLERKAKGFIELVEENLLGLGGKGSLTALMGSRDAYLLSRLWSDRFLYSMITYDLQAGYRQKEDSFFQETEEIGSYQTQSLHGSITLGRQMRRLGTVSATLRAEHLHETVQHTALSRTEKNVYFLNTLTFRSEVDSRNQRPFPTQGRHHVLEFETGLTFIGGTQSYVKLFSSMESFSELLPGICFHPKITWGTADLNTPLYKQFRLGGLRSFYGLPEGAFIGKRFLVLNGELRMQLPFLAWLKPNFSFRYDFGGIWDHYKNIQSEDFIHGLGGALSFDTILGPLTLGVGYYEKKSAQIYFSAGYPF